MKEWMNEWLNNEWIMNEWMRDWVNKWMDEGMNNKWMSECVIIVVIITHHLF